MKSYEEWRGTDRARVDTDRVPSDGYQGSSGIDGARVGVAHDPVDMRGESSGTDGERVDADDVSSECGTQVRGPMR